MKKIIYLDNAATTMMEPSVINKMQEYMELYGNPSSVYDVGLQAKEQIEIAREYVATLIGANPSEIYFTSGGSEADNWALRSSALLKPSGKIITSKIEHHAVLNTCSFLENYIDVVYLDVDTSGKVSIPNLLNEIDNNISLVSIMMANNEIGTLQPIEKISDIAHSHDSLMHTDAVQAFGHIPINVKEIGIDMLSASAHKLGGPKGIGCLYIRDGIKLSPLIFGGGQEKHLRAGTENTLGIIGFGEAARLANEQLESNMVYVQAIRDSLQHRIMSQIQDVRFNGDMENRLSNNLSVTFKGVRAETLLMLLNEWGICVSTGSACNSSEKTPSHVLTAIGLNEDEANSTVRFSLSHNNTMEEIDYTVNALKMCVEQIRRK